MRMDRCNQILLSVSFLILLACYAVSALVQPLPAAVRYTALGVALELALAALMARAAQSRERQHGAVLLQGGDRAVFGGMRADEHGTAVDSVRRDGR